MGKKLTVKSGKGELKLRKSENLVGLKTTRQEKLDKKEYVQDSYFEHLGGFEVVSLNTSSQSLDDKLDAVRKEDDISQGTHVYLANGSNRPLVPTGELYITFSDGTSTEEQNLVLEEYNLEEVERRNPFLLVARVTDKSPNPIKVANLLSRISLVQSAEPDLDTFVDNYEFRPPGDSLFAHQWQIHNNGHIPDSNHPVKSGADAKILEAWNRLGGLGSSDIVVAVIDNGFDINHPDLRSKVYKPWDLWRNSSNITMGNPQFSHGTPCASIALAASNGTGMVGVAPNARFMPVSGTSFSVRATEQMFETCVNNGADIISCSWGTTDPNFALNSLKSEAIRKAAKEGRNGKGCVILFAGGNEGSNAINLYATHPDVICVGATTSQDQHASYSNSGRELMIVAPSNGDWPLIAARASWDPGSPGKIGAFKYWNDGVSRGDQYKHFGGTSAATPLVAGVCALILSANPDLTAREVREVLIGTADKIGSPWEYTAGHSVKYGYGKVNADKAVAEAIRRKATINRPEPVIVPTTITPPPPSPSPVPSASNEAGGLLRFSVKNQASAGWGVQIGAFADFRNVLERAENLERTYNAPVVLQISESNNRHVFKIILGSFDRVNDAKALSDRLKENGINGFLRNLKDI
ncbi:MAG: S8 family serine peptidase [Saprospiraceae bacterium]|nr:S8 family serine peptidase [Saprospiraceae bacterium]